MTEWWSYRPSDFVLFSANSWWRMVEVANAETWPAPLVTLAFGVVVAIAALRTPRGVGSRRFAVASFVALAACWAWLSATFFARHYATINWAAPWFALAFAAQAVLLVGCAASLREWKATAGVRRAIGETLLIAAVLGYPFVGAVFGRPWTQAEAFGAAPDPTALATIGLLLVVRPSAHWLAGLLWPLPIAWLAVSATTLATMR